MLEFAGGNDGIYIGTASKVSWENSQEGWYPETIG